MAPLTQTVSLGASCSQSQEWHSLFKITHESLNIISSQNQAWGRSGRKVNKPLPNVLHLCGMCCEGFHLFPFLHSLSASKNFPPTYFQELAFASSPFSWSLIVFSPAPGTFNSSWYLIWLKVTGLSLPLLKSNPGDAGLWGLLRSLITRSGVAFFQVLALGRFEICSLVSQGYTQECCSYLSVFFNSSADPMRLKTYKDCLIFNSFHLCAKSSHAKQLLPNKNAKVKRAKRRKWIWRSSTQEWLPA